MRRIDIFLIGIAIFVAGTLVYILFRLFGLGELKAGVWSQLVLVVGLLSWIFSYLFRAVTGNMTYNRQVEEYKAAVLEKQLESLSEEELAALQAQIESETEEEEKSTP